MATAVAEELPVATTQQQVGLLMVAKGLMDSLQQWIRENAEAKQGKESSPSNVYQFKITLLGSKPPIWRRIQVHDCTLVKLHEHIQTAMGWTNSHLHDFEIKGKRYGDPELLDDGFDDFECEDSTITFLSDILPAKGKKFRFRYEYDFGDGWEHDILFEGYPPVDPKAKYPLCLEGERACPGGLRRHLGLPRHAYRPGQSKARAAQ